MEVTGFGKALCALAHWVWPPRVEGESEEILKWRRRITVLVLGGGAVMTGAVAAVIVWLFWVFVPNVGTAGEIATLEQELRIEQQHIANKLDQQRDDLKDARVLALEIRLDGLQEKICLAESMDNDEVAVAYATAMRSQEVEYRALSGRDYEPLPCPF